jgi:hypothetical protein
VSFSSLFVKNLKRREKKPKKKREKYLRNMDPCVVLQNIEPINAYVIKPIKPHIECALRNRQYRDALKKKVENLDGKQQQLKHLVADARRET